VVVEEENAAAAGGRFGADESMGDAASREQRHRPGPRFTGEQPLDKDFVP
jgi:hypothetical protein